MFHRPRLILAGLSGGAGKTILSLGLTRAWLNSGRKVKPFKKGPDYIDAAWLGLAGRATATNLDPFLFPPEKIPPLFLEKSAGADISVIEGNRGLFDGKDTSGSCSTAELARLLSAPVVLIMDCTKMTRTAAAILAGCRNFEPGLNLAGVILNRTAGERHRNLLRKCIETYTDVPVLGILPKVKPDPIPERHMGLMSSQEYATSDETLEKLGRIAAAHVDMNRLWDIACAAPDLPQGTAGLWDDAPSGNHAGVRIGVIRDAALWFYYEENLEALQRQGVELVELSLLSDAPWPEIHGLYLGGGFPETQAERLAANEVVRARVKSLADDGLPIYSECGGFMYLAKELIYEGRTYPMAGVFPVSTELSVRPQGHGYTLARVRLDNPYHPVGLEFSGHEFHYSKCPCLDFPGLVYSLDVLRGHGITGDSDGLIHKNTFAAYTHIHALGVPTWAANFAAAAARRAASGRGHCIP